MQALVSLLFNYLENLKIHDEITGNKTRASILSATQIRNIFRFDKYLAHQHWDARRKACRSSCKVKVKLVLGAIKAYGEVEVQLHSILTSAPEWIERIYVKLYLKLLDVKEN